MKTIPYIKYLLAKEDIPIFKSCGTLSAVDRGWRHGRPLRAQKRLGCKIHPTILFIFVKLENCIPT